MKNYIIPWDEKKAYPKCWEVEHTFNDEDFEQQRETTFLDDAFDLVNIKYNAYEDTLIIETQEMNEVHVTETHLLNMLKFVRDSKKSNKNL